MSPARERAEKLQRARNLPPRERKRVFPVNRLAVPRMSRVQEKAGRLGRTRNLQMPPRRERMFLVNRPAVRRPSAAQERAERAKRARNLRPAPKREQMFPVKQPAVRRPARSSRGKG